MKQNGKINTNETGFQGKRFSMQRIYNETPGVNRAFHFTFRSFFFTGRPFPPSAG